MNTPLFNSRFSNRRDMEIEAVVAREVESSETHGAVETLEQKVKTLTEIVGLLATYLTPEQKVAMAGSLGYTEVKKP